MKAKIVRPFILLLFTIMISTFAIAGCSNNTESDNEKIKSTEKINLYTTLYVLADFSHEIGGDYVNVVNLVPPGVSPHDYEPTAKDMTLLIKGDIFVYNGAGLEGWVDKIMVNIDQSKVKVVNASRNIHLIDNMDEDELSKHPLDAHVWLDPLNAIKQAEEIKNGLVKADEKNATVYEANFQKLKDRLLALDKDYRDQLTDVKRKDFFVSHAAFGYLAREYGLIQHPISGVIPADEPSPTEMANIINTAKELNIKYILVDPKDITKISEVAANEIGAQTMYIDTVASLTKEELDKGLNYFKIMKNNLQAFKTALNE